MAHIFQASEAVRDDVLLRFGIHGVAGSGKSRTAIAMGCFLVEKLACGPLYVIDSENRSALRYAHNKRTGQGFRFKHVPMPEDDYSPQTYMAAIDYCESQGAGVILVDSFTHAWNGINGVLEQVDRERDKFSGGWKKMTPVQNRMVQRVLASSAHVIFTLRSKMDYVIEQNERGKAEPKKIGLGAIQREGFDYEPDGMARMDLGAILTIEKSRMEGAFSYGDTFEKPGPEFFGLIVDWLNGAEAQGEPRSLTEALTVATVKGIEAARARDADAYKAARASIVAWAQHRGVAKARLDTALHDFKTRVSAAVPQPVSAEGTPPPSSGRKPADAVPSDEDRAAAIDRGAA